MKRTETTFAADSLAWSGSSHCAALAGGDGTGRVWADGAGSGKGGARAEADGVSLRSQRRPHGRLDAQGSRSRLPDSADTCKPLEAYKDDLLVLTGLAQHNAEALGDGPGDHARSLACFLTGAHPLKTDGAGIRVGVSVDQVAAQKVGRQTRLPSLELGIERGAQSGNCDSGYSCAYSSNISWRSANMPMAKEINPKLVFDRLFRLKIARGFAGRSNQTRTLSEEHPGPCPRRCPAAPEATWHERPAQDR